VKLTAYHATDMVKASNILRQGFRLDVANRSDPGDFGQAVYLTTSMARAKAIGKAILTVDLELQSPLELTDAAAYALVIDVLGFDTIHGKSHPGGRHEAAKKAREHFLAQGHDAMISRRAVREEAEMEIAVYDLKAIKRVRL
jgi:hypothetical protein